MPASICCKNIKVMGIQSLGLVSFLGIRKTLNNRIYLQIKLEDEMPIDVKQIDNEDFEVTFFLYVITNHKVKVSNIAYSLISRTIGIQG